MNVEELSEQISGYLHGLMKYSQIEGEMTRLPFTRAANAASDYLYEEMKKAGLETKKELNGAISGILPGKTPQRIVIGSHYDTVANGGIYDGCLGIACGIAYAAYLYKHKMTPFYTIEILATNDEEGVRFHTGYFTIKSMLGEIDQKYLKEHVDSQGISIYEAMKESGMEPDRIEICKRQADSIKHFFEIHIEQGPVLEANHKTIGIVDSIVGIRRYEVTIRGRADHAGTIPMEMRKDALMKAAETLQCLRKRCLQYRETVLTAGYMQVYPNVVNIVPEKVVFTLDIRSTSEEVLRQMDTFCQDMSKTDDDISFHLTLFQEPVEMDERYTKQLEKAADDKGYTWMHLYSGAGHDSLEAAKVWDTNMIFIPSKAGRSHCPEEYSDVKDAAKATILLDILINAIK